MSANDVVSQPRQLKTTQHKMQLLGVDIKMHRGREESVKKGQKIADSHEKFHMQQQTIFFLFLLCCGNKN